MYKRQPISCSFHLISTPSHSDTFDEEKGKKGCNIIAILAIRYAQLLIVFLHSSRSVSYTHLDVYKRQDLNNEDALGVITPRTYKNIPFFVSTNGYGVFFNHSSLMTFWLGSMSACNIQVAIEDNFLDYFIFTGKIKKILKNYTCLLYTS